MSVLHQNFSHSCIIFYFFDLDVEEIPSSLDILVAGFCCVDFSILNSKMLTLEQRGGIDGAEASGAFSAL